MSFSQQQIDQMTAAVASGTELTSVDGLTVRTNIEATIKALQFAQACNVAANSSTGRRPFMLNFLRSPGGIYGSGRR